MKPLFIARMCLGAMVVTVPALTNAATASEVSPKATGRIETARKTDQQAVIANINAYVASINAGDNAAAKAIWLNSDDISFINSGGIHHGWAAIEKNVHSFFRDAFTKRDLRLTGEPVVQFFGNTAVAEFVWDFDGTMVSGKELHTRGGRESQVFIRVPKLGWRLVHAHYSTPP